MLVISEKNTFKALLLLTLTITSVSAAQPANTGPKSFICQVEGVQDALTIGQHAVRATGGTLGHVYRHALNGFSIQVPPGIVMANLRRQAGILNVEPDLTMHTCDEILPTGIDRIDAEGFEGPVDVDIAILDTGVGPHEELNISGGVRFYSKGRRSYSDENYADVYGHGTHCAGIAAAENDEDGVVGVAPGARIWAVKVLGDNGSGKLSDIIAGIDWVTANADTIEVASMSLGGTGVSEAYQQAIQQSIAAGVVYVVAAGNESDDVYGVDGILGTSDDHIPAAYPEAMTISAMADMDGSPSSDDGFANFSNYSRSVVGDNPVSSGGAAIDLILPGVNIYSTLPNNDYGSKSGTSMATPHAAGLVARYIAENVRASDAAGVYAIRQALIDAGKAQNDLDFGFGEDGNEDPDSNKEPIGWAGFSTSDPTPTITIISPTDGEVVSEEVTIRARATDTTKVEFLLNGSSLGDGELNDGFCSISWDTTINPDGSYTLCAFATGDGSGTAADYVDVTVDNVPDPVSPTIDITSPTGDDTVSGNVTIQAKATHTAAVEFFLDDTIEGYSLGIGTLIGDIWTITWETNLDPDGSHTIHAVATGDGGTATDSVEVIVENELDPVTSKTHIDTLAQSSSWVNRAKWIAKVTITVVDNAGAPVAGAEVHGIWVPGISSSAVTEENGVCVISSSSLHKSVSSTTFTVDMIIGPGEYIYDPMANTQSSIIVFQP